jgi:hypothetical protein
MRGFGILAVSAGSLSAAACAAALPEGCIRQPGHPIPTPEGQLIFTPATIVCPLELPSDGETGSSAEKETHR